jgi:hypothetical protein
MAGLMEMMDEVWDLWRRALTPDPQTTYICNLTFTKPDPELFPEAEYSGKEVIIYNGISPHVMTDTPDHALLLKRNVRRGRFELHRYYHHDGSVEVIFTGSFMKVLGAIDHELQKYRPELLGRIKPCEHKPPHVDRAECPIFRRRVEELRKEMEEAISEILEVERIIKMHEERLRRLRERWERLRREMEGLA